MLNSQTFTYQQYSKEWSDYACKTNRREYTQPFLIHLVELQQGISKPKYAADIGCGSGNELLYLIKNDYEVVGLDANKDAVSKANIKCREFKGCKILQHDLNVPPELSNQDLYSGSRI